MKTHTQNTEENSNKRTVRDKEICTGEDVKTGKWNVLNCTHDYRA